MIGNVDGSIQGWTTKDGWKSGVALKRPRAVTGLAYTADAKTLVESHAEGVELTDRKTGNYRGRVGPPAAGRAVVALAPHPRPDRVAVVGPDREVIVWDSTRNRPVRTYRGHTAGVSALAFSPDGTRLASAGGDLGVRVWDLGKEPGMRTVAEFPAPVGAFAAAADGSRFAVAPRFGASPAEHRIIVLDAAGKPVRVVPGAGDAALSRDGRRVAGGRPGGGVAVWDTTTAAEVWSRPEAGGARGGVRVVLSPDGSRLASWSPAGGGVRVDAVAGGEAVAIPAGGRFVTGLAFSRDGERVAVAGADGLSVWAAVTGTKAAWVDGPREAFAVAFDPAGTAVAAAEPGAVRVRNAQTGEVRQAFESGPLRVAAVCFSPDSSRLVTGGADCAVRVWDVASGHELLTLPAGGDAVTGVAWVGDRVFATAGGAVHAWDGGAD